MKIKKGERYKTKSEGDFNSGTNLIVLFVTGETLDDFVYWKAETPKKDNRIKGNKNYNSGSARVWWFRDFCLKVESSQNKTNTEDLE